MITSLFEKEQWTPYINRELVIGFIMFERDSDNGKDVKTYGVKENLIQYGETFRSDSKIIGVLQAPFPTYEISYYAPYDERVILGYEFSNINYSKWDWYGFMRTDIVGELSIEGNKEYPDQEYIEYLDRCEKKCKQASHKFKEEIKEKEN